MAVFRILAFGIFMLLIGLAGLIFYEHRKNVVEVKEFQAAKQERFNQTIKQQEAFRNENFRRALEQDAGSSTVKKRDSDQVRTAEQIQRNSEFVRQSQKR